MIIAGDGAPYVHDIKAERHAHTEASALASVATPVGFALEYQGTSNRRLSIMSIMVLMLL